MGRKDHQQPNHVRSLRDSFRIKKEANFFLQSPTLGKAPTKSLKLRLFTEDVTPLRSKLLNYVKNHCDGEFVLCHTYNGRIRMKKSARKHGNLLTDEKDEGVGEWLMVSSPDDLFKLDIDVNFRLLDYKPLLINENIDSQDGVKSKKHKLV